MGHTLDEWIERVGQLLRDEDGVDVYVDAVEATGLRPAIGQFSADQPASTIVELEGTGSPYLALPETWERGVSRLTSIEYPARSNPPELVDSQAWSLTRDPDDVDVDRVLLYGLTPVAGQYIRFTIDGPWPYPTTDADDDVIGASAFEAVCHLAASHCCVALAGAAARARAGALPTDFVDGRDRSRLLLDAAARYRAVYETFLGLSSAGDGGGDGGGSSAPPAFARIDFDPANSSLFHGGRR